METNNQSCKDPLLELDQSPDLPVWPPSVIRDIKALNTLETNYGNILHTSLGKRFSGDDKWGRDSSITAADLAESHPETTKAIILTLASIQGTEHVGFSGEEFGKIPTEQRRIYDNDELELFNFKEPFDSKLFMSVWSIFVFRNGWSEYTNYYSSDTTPIFINTVYEYAKFDKRILAEEVTQKDGSKRSIEQCLIGAAEYIANSVSQDGLIRIKEENLGGRQFPYWRDDPAEHVDENGNIINGFDEQVILDVQALAAHALNQTAELIHEPESENVKLSEYWRQLSKKVVDATIERFWMPQANYFSSLLYKDKTGNFAQLKTMQSNAGWLLNTDFFDRIENKQIYIEAIVQKLFSSEFLTDAGVRCRSLEHIYDRDRVDYHGSWVVWPFETFQFALGLKRQGFSELAEQLENRIVNVTNQAGNNYEFFIVDEAGRVLLDPNTSKDNCEDCIEIDMVPEPTQAWTVTAVNWIKRNRTKQYKAKKQAVTDGPSSDFEQQILKGIKNIGIYKTMSELKKDTPDPAHYYLDVEVGRNKVKRDVVDMLVNHWHIESRRRHRNELIRKAGGKAIARILNIF